MPTDDHVGQLLADKYRLEAHLGSGGMANVYRAVNDQIGRAVAIKRLRPELAEYPEVVERFLREARTANLVRHPNVVDVIDLGTDERGMPFLVQELLEGVDLARYAASRGGVLSREEIVTLVLPVVHAVATAHARGVVHRDLKPDNVFVATIEDRRVPKLLDFGISKVVTKGVRATDAGVMLGTPAYMAPEQVKGARDADARSDVWALGVMLFELLSGRLPFQQDAPALFLAIVGEDAPRLLDVAPRVDPSLSRVVARCLRRSPDERYPSAAELARDLKYALEGEELEPTLRRSIVPALADFVPDLALPRPAAVPELGTPPAPSARMRAGGIAPEAPASPRATPALQLEAAPRPAPLPGIGATVPARITASATGGMRLPPPAQAGSPAGGRVVAICGVGVASLALVAVLVAIFHRAGGWPVARFLVSATGTLETASQVILALAALLVGGSRAKHAIHQWEGENAGGIPGALVTTAFGAAALFCAYELLLAA